MAIFKVTAVPDFSQLKSEIAKLQSSPVTLGVDTRQANVNIKTTAKNVATAQEVFQDAGKKAQQSSEKAAEKVRDVGKAAKETSGFADLMGDSFGRVAAKMALWQVMGNAIAGLKRSFTEALETMKDVDDEMVTIRKVTGATTEELNKIEKQAYETASAYGVAADEYLSSVANFSRAGYGEQASALAELATKTQIVGDTNAETAQQFLLSVDAAYKYQGSIEQLTKVLDGANEIDNRYATSISKIAEGLGKVAPIAAQAHVGVDELTAAIGTITAVTQRSGTEASTALRALFLNIIGDTKTEIDEGVTWTTGEIAGLRDVIKLYAKDAYDAAQASGDVINPMKAIAGLSKSMKDGLLTEQQLMEMVSDIGGKLRTSQLLALIQNWDMYQSMLGDFADAAGSADKEVENALDSWTRKTEILHNKWTQFVSNLVETDTIKDALDGVIGLVELLDSEGGHLVITVGLLTGAVLLLGHAKKELMASEAVKDIKAASAAIKELTAKVIAYAAAKKAAAAGDGEMALHVAELKENLAGALGKLKAFGIGAAIFAALALAISLSTEKARAYKEALEDVETAQGALDETKSEYDELINKTGELTDAEKKRLEVLKELRQEQEKQLDAAQKSAWEAWNAAHGSGASTVVGGAEGVGGGLGVGAVKMERMDVVALRNYREELEAIEAQYRAGELSAGAYYDALQDLNAAREDSVETIRAAIDAGYEVTEEQRQLVAAYDRVQQMLGVTQNATKDYVSKLIEEARQSGATGKALYDLVAAQIAASKTGLDFSQQVAALKELAVQAGYTSEAIAQVFAMYGNATVTHDQVSGYIRTMKLKYGKTVTEEEAAAALLQERWKALKTNYTPSVSGGGYSGGGGSSSGESALRKKAQAEIDALKKARDAETAVIDEQIEALKKQNEETERGEKLEELKLNILKKQDALLNARNERTVRQYNAATGQWEWVADPSKVKKAEEDLEDAKKDLRDYEREVELDVALSELEARKKAIEAAYQIKIDAWNDYLNGLADAVRREKELLDESVKNNQNNGVQGNGGNNGSNNTGISAGVDSIFGDTGQSNLNKWKDTKAGDIIGNVTGGSSGKPNGIPSGTTAKDILEGTKKKPTGIPSGTTAKDILSGTNGAGTYQADSAEVKKRAAELLNSGKASSISQAFNLAKKELTEAKRRAGVYDSGGVLRGMGGIKATVDDEMVLPPDVTAKMLKPSADARFRARVNELGGLYGETPVSHSVAGSSDNRSYSDHSGPTYNVKGITLTEQQAEHLTVAQMCRMAHNVKPYGG